MKRAQITILFISLITMWTITAQGAEKAPKQQQVNVQKTSLTREQEAMLGNQAAAQVEREMEVLQNPEVEAWLNQIGQQLAKTPQANAYPYHFKLVNEESINAFALPGGPMFVHTGLIRAADNEGEVAGVLAHEMSHVALRHGAAQMSKQQTWGSIFGVLQTAAGALNCGMMCQAAQAGAGLGGNSLLMKFSRGYERDADLNGARMMASAGYNPIGLPNFFEKLKAQTGTATEPKGLQLWLSSHPATGNRIEYVSDDIKFYAKKDYSNNTGNFARVKQIVTAIPPPKLKPPALLSVVQGTPRQGLPLGFKDYAAKGFSVAYPGTWQAGQAQEGGSVYLAPQGGAAQGQNNGVELITGAMIDYYVPASGASATNLDRTTNEFIESLKKGDTSLRAERSNPGTLGGKPSLNTLITTKTSTGVAQTVFLSTVARQAGLWYMVMAAPTDQEAALSPGFQQMMGTVLFPNDVP